jgi:DNA-binding MarR family transcriptional regulator
LLLELVVDPPREGDRISDLASRLQLSPSMITTAAEVLAEAGLAKMDGDVVRASPTALRFEALWPIAP